MSLWKIDSMIEQIVYRDEAIDEETGEILDTEALDRLDMERTKKLEAIACIIKNEDAAAAAIKAEIDALTKRMKAHLNREENLERYMLRSFNLYGEKKFEAPRCKVSVRTTPSVRVFDLEMLPNNYRRIIPEKWEPDKVNIKTALKNGEPVPGCELVNNQSLIIK